MARSSSATRRQAADRPPSHGGLFDGRTLIARRRRELIEIYTIGLGGPDALSDGRHVDVRRTAELVAIAEAARARVIRESITDPVELSAMVRVESTAARALRALNLPAASAPKPASLADYLAARAAAKAASKPRDTP